MRVKYYLIMSLALFVLISPIISNHLRAASPENTTTITSDSIVMPTEIEVGADIPLVYVLTIDGAIGAVTDDRISDAIVLCEENQADLLVIFMDTPGGYSNATSSICKSILNSDVPVCTYVAPSGGRAGSAGVYIAYASHFAAMAPSTNIGAAHPVSGAGEEIDSIMNEKITNDAVAQIKAAAQKRGRNAEWAEKAVRESVSITDNEALEMNVIDLRAENLDDLLEQLDGRTTELPDGEKKIRVAGAKTENIEMTFAQEILRIISQPEIVVLLISLAGLGIMLELYNPGSILPGVAGAIAGLLALYGVQILPINYSGLALIILALILWVAEVKVISHGILTIGGIISFFFGGLMLVDTVDPSLKVSIAFLIIIAVMAGAMFFLMAWLYLRTSRRKPAIGNEGMIGKTAEVRTKGMVYVDGALWQAVCVSGEKLPEGGQVEIVEVDGLTLKVKILNI